MAQLLDRLSIHTDIADKDLEAWVVNTLKVKMISKLDNLLEREGRENARRLLLVPIFSISEMSKRIKEQAPEMKTFYYRELMDILEKASSLTIMDRWR